MMKLKSKKKTFLKTKISKKMKIKKKKMKLRNSKIMKNKLLSKKTCQMKQRISLNKQMQSLNNKKREVEVMVVDIVVE